MTGEPSFQCPLWIVPWAKIADLSVHPLGPSAGGVGVEREIWVWLSGLAMSFVVGRWWVRRSR
jgi:hypothetical protein